MQPGKALATGSHEFEVVLQPEEEGGFSVSVPALPGCHTQGETREEALADDRGRDRGLPRGAWGASLPLTDFHRVGRYDLLMTKAELHRQIEAMTEEEAAEVKLIYAPDWPSKTTLIGEIRKRTGTTPMSSEDFDRHFGSLPTDGEG
jgi:hypothetical protein